MKARRKAGAPRLRLRHPHRSPRFCRPQGSYGGSVTGYVLRNSKRLEFSEKMGLYAEPLRCSHAEKPDRSSVLDCFIRSHAEGRNRKSARESGCGTSAPGILTLSRQQSKRSGSCRSFCRPLSRRSSCFPAALLSSAQVTAILNPTSGVGCQFTLKT